MSNPDNGIVRLCDSKDKGSFLCFFHSKCDTYITIEASKPNEVIHVEECMDGQSYSIVSEVFSNTLKFCLEKKKFCSFSKKNKTVNIFTNLDYVNKENFFLSIKKVKDKSGNNSFEVKICSLTTNNNKVVFESHTNMDDRAICYSLIYNLYDALDKSISRNNVSLQKCKSIF